MTAIKNKIITIFFSVISLQFAQAQTVGWFQNSPLSYDGYTLFAPLGSDTTYLIDNCGKLLHKWTSAYNPGSSAYLLPDGNLLRPGTIPNAAFPAGGKGGIIEKIDWNSNVVWSYIISNTNECAHHDIKQLPNGNIIAVVWEKKTAAEAINAGRNPANLANSLWSEKVLELQPTGTNTAVIVWEWHVWDHIIQDFDSTKNNFGVVINHPELVDINFTTASGVDWLHINSIDYNPVLDQVMLSIHNHSELWIIDHSTTTAQAASHTGGNSGMGGDILYRWGNPQAYHRGTATDKKLFGQHDAQWIKTGIPNEGKIIVFNNGLARPAGNYSTIEIIDPPVLPSGNYTILPSQPFDPATSYWTYPAIPDFSFYSYNISGVMPQPNGNFLICEGDNGKFFEVDSTGQLLWKYISPVSSFGIITQGNPATGNSVFKIKRYETNYSGFAGQIITQGSPIEINPLNYSCTIYPLAVNELMTHRLKFNIYPNPATEFLVINLESGVKTKFKITIYNTYGKLCLQTTNALLPAKINTGQFSKGIYFIIIEDENERVARKFLKE